MLGLDLAVANDNNPSVVKALIQPRKNIDEIDSVSLTKHKLYSLLYICTNILIGYLLF